MAAKKKESAVNLTMDPDLAAAVAALPLDPSAVFGDENMIRLLRSCGFVVDDLIEIQAPEPAHRDYAEVSAAWAHRWPSEEVWKARLGRVRHHVELDK